MEWRYRVGDKNGEFNELVDVEASVRRQLPRAGSVIVIEGEALDVPVNVELLDSINTFNKLGVLAEILLHGKIGLWLLLVRVKR